MITSIEKDIKRTREEKRKKYYGLVYSVVLNIYLFVSFLLYCEKIPIE